MDSAQLINQNLYDLEYEQLIDFLARWGYSAFHVDQVWNYLYCLQVTAVSQMETLRPDLKQN